MEREIIVKSISMNIQNLNEKMNNAIMHLEKEFQSLRTSRANPLMLENISVEAYGAKTPINQLGNISAPDPSTLTIQVWDNNLIKNVENAILESNLGLNPQSDGPIIRLPIPKLSEERRQELTKIASQYAENSKVVIRNLRRDFIDIKKNDKKNSEISEDELKKFINDAQKSTDNSIEGIEKLLESKRNEILKV
ncbi:MAG: Ribosome-recycling factor [Alphaproteobacteria bacterium MarineAlpha5_Bin5]|nr:MAG: Ribosome-recycling factor [Alphaproteobacteria bacterium MarineAlpha5_Bin5]|tara:strand:- start:905 stop:1486 length:582 start_codon:yes stop_codon:yes gene_type:complete